VILDTHTLIWVDRSDPNLGTTTLNLVENTWRNGMVAVSAISFWEVAMLVDRKRIVLPVPVNQWRMDWLQSGLVEIPIDGKIALLSCQLEYSHKDPADRFIVSTAMTQKVPLLTADQKILEWEGDLECFDCRN
jgi:PIN domain nuclease of toxin-antitoxin system